MLVSLKELNKYVSLENLSPEDMAKGLTFAGVEVEEICKLASGTNLVIGEILDCRNHPDSNHLHILKVNLGTKYGIQQIVCGAPNAKKGLKVIVSRVGAKLPGGEIKASVIRGVESNGMCCSLSELGVESKYLNEYQLSGIEELPLDAPVGEENVLGYLGLDDAILNINVLANRPDLLSLYNIAREVGAIFNRKVNIPSYENVVNFKTELKVGSETKSCSQFAGCEIRGIKIKESPKWLKDFLMAEGVRSINNIVDIGNYVMLLTGQPLHMYDADKLPVKELIAKDNYKGPFVALDEKSYDVIENDIVITSNNKPMCLGGVMGSLECAVDNNTKNIYVESASFDGATIRHTSNRLGLASESSSRFVKGTNRYQSENVIALTKYLVKELCEATDMSNIVNMSNEAFIQKVIKTNVAKINSLIATNFTFEQINDVLTRLNFVVLGSEKDMSVSVPKFRLDIDGSADLSEEVIRILGYDNVTVTLPNIEVETGGLTIEQNRLRTIRNYLTNIGLDECVTYSLISKKETNLFNLLNNEEHHVLLNPLTDDKEVLRTHILHSLLKVTGYNIARQAKDLMLFETGEVISKSSRSTHLAIVLSGNKCSQGLLQTQQFDFFDIKGIVEEIFGLIGIENSRYKFERCTNAGKELHPGKSADIVFQGKIIGRCGELHPNQYDIYDLGKSNTVVLEMDIFMLLNAKVSTVKMMEFSKFPSISRDLALVVDTNITAADLLKTIKMTGKGLVSDAEIFDVYVGQNIGEGKKSIALRITFMSYEHTLLDKEISDVLDKIKFELTKVYHAELRG